MKKDICFVLLPHIQIREMKVYFVIACWAICVATPDLSAQRRISPEEYINVWKDFAISEMQRSGIPASIKLAQGMLESANGNSRLAVGANNHFGIKCHGWDGEEVYHDDDKRNECFRKYKNANESFIDHTDFLMTRSRYAFLFEYRPTDYKSWATGLRRAGYATDPNYPQKLINLIERYNLYQYDAGVTVDRRISVRRTPEIDAWDDFNSFNIERYPLMINNRTNFIVAKDGDTYSSLSNEMDMMPWQLPKYNEAKQTDELREGQWVYLQPKRRIAERGRETHTVREGETMYQISQEYAVRLSRLYVLNRMEEGTQPKVGEMLHLRKKKKK